MNWHGTGDGLGESAGVDLECGSGQRSAPCVGDPVNITSNQAFDLGELVKTLDG